MSYAENTGRDTPATKPDPGRAFYVLRVPYPESDGTVQRTGEFLTPCLYTQKAQITVWVDNLSQKSVLFCPNCIKNCRIRIRTYGGMRGR